MPLYEFHCQSCNRYFELRRTFSQGTADVACPACAGADIQRVFTPVSAFSRGSYGSTSLGGGGCSSCTITNCSGCPSVRRR